MRRFFFGLLFLLISCALYAAKGDRRLVSDTIHSQLEAVKYYLYSNEWKPVEIDAYNRMIELVEFIENSPIDSVIGNLKNDVERVETFFKRNVNFISEVEKIEGYINAQHINNNMINIEKRVADEVPFESIVVPESKFTGMYSKLPLITYGNMEKLISDSIVVYPDSLLLLITANLNSKRFGKSKESDSIIHAFLDKARKHYNDSIIAHFRDSITFDYRKNYQKNYADSLAREYTNEVARINRRILEKYNDSISVVINEKYKAQLNSLINYVDRMPNPITFYNLQNEPITLELENQGVWYRWLWLKNTQNDSIGIRILNLDKHSVKVLVDETVNLSRMTQRESIEIAKVEPTKSIDQKLHKINVKTPVVSNWQLKGKAYSGFTQTFINQFWSKGGKSSASTLSTVDYDANYSKGKLKWENGLNAKLGLIYYIDDNPSAKRDWHKNSDNFEMNSRLGYSAFKEWYYSAEANFKTQFFLGYNNNTVDVPNSALFSPAYLTFSGGFDFKPNKKMSAFLSPLSVKTTYVSNPEVDETRFGLSEGQSRKSRIGMTGRLDYSNEIFENINLKTKNGIFINFGSKDGEWQLFKLPDFDTETTIDFKVNQFISTQVNFHFIYDKEVESKWTEGEIGSEVEKTGTRLQAKEFLTLGISYKF